MNLIIFNDKIVKLIAHDNDVFFFRWDYADRDPDLQGFKYLKENGVKAKYMQGVFPTQTSPNHFSIATGVWKFRGTKYHTLDF